ncbi:MAG: hydrogenase expression/formation protein HypE [Chloroflexota bacterium]|nr:MAG: hydrogenase expression/formation protein HypE [Chloroflexota bacterium]
MDDRILLAHGSGGKLSHELVQKQFLPFLANPALNKLDDSAIFEASGKLAFTTDSYVVNPIFFPGGDIGKLAVCGTVNDLAMNGAKPLYLSLSAIIEEGLLISELETIVQSIRKAAEEAEVNIIAGDTKVVNRGQADKLFITTSGVGMIPTGVDISGANARAGDKVLLSGTIGEHGIAVMSQREGLRFSMTMESDCAPLNKLVGQILEVTSNIHCLRDPTRGGLATTLNELAQQSEVGIIVDEAKIPVKDEVKAACELLGLDPLYVANEGKLVVMIDPADADGALTQMKKNDYGRDAAIIGEVTGEHPGKVVMRTKLGPSRIVDMLSGELLPRIC